MKKVVTIIFLSFLAFISVIGLSSHSAEAAMKSVPYNSISEDKYEPLGDPKIGYPQISIRTNRTEERTNLNEVIEIADNAANAFPSGDYENRSKAVLTVLNDYFNSGNVGHAWIIVFNSDQPGDFTSYAYHDQGYTKNGTDPETGNDSAERRFHAEKVVKLNIPGEEFSRKFERDYVPQLNSESYQMGQIMGLDGSLETGIYTPVNNCAWFAGATWKYATNDQTLIYEQDFDGSAHVESWGMPFLGYVNKIADPGMLAESILLTPSF